jgi:hypothetical protein
MVRALHRNVPCPFFLSHDAFGENLMHDNVGYMDIRKRVRQHYESCGEPCPFEELQNLCYFIAVLAHGTPDLAVRNFSPIKQAAVWEILHHIQVHHVEEVRLVRLVRDRMVEAARRQGMTAGEANVVAKVALYHEFLQMPYPAPHNGRRHS